MKKLLSYPTLLLTAFSMRPSSKFVLHQTKKDKSAQSKSASTSRQKDDQVPTPPPPAPAPTTDNNPELKAKRRTVAVLDFGDARHTILKKNPGRQFAILLSFDQPPQLYQNGGGSSSIMSL